MSYYRTYRPKVIEEIDNDAIRERLLTLLTKDKKELPHAFLLSGPRGTGKTTTARLIAKLFNCQKPKKNGAPCGRCDMCVAIAQGTAIDILEIDAASNTGVDNIRDLRDKIYLAPSQALWKAYIIDEVHMLSTGAFNALLKILEEPPPHAIFVLATTDPGKVPITIHSRCVNLVFNRPTIAELVHAVTHVVKEEKLAIDDEAVKLIATYADGSFRDAHKLLEQASFHKGKITADVVYSLLSMSEEQVQKTFIAHLARRNAKEALASLTGVVGGGRDVRAFLVGCLQILEKELTSSVEGKQSDFWSLPDLNAAIRKLSQAFVEMKTTSIIQLPLELAVVEYCEEGGSTSDEESPKDAEPDQDTTRVHQRSNPRGPAIKTQKEGEVRKSAGASGGLLTLEKLNEHWRDVIDELKPHNHSVAGVLRSSRPKAVKHGIVTIEAFYPFHQERLSEPKTREMIASVLKKLFGEKVKVEIVLGKK